MPGAYEGLRVLDFTQGLAGPMACGLFAQFGADVVKVEPPAGDRMQAHPGYLAWNCNKRRVTVDLATAAGLEAARSLIAAADVAVFDAAPGELEKLGLDGATLTARHPALVHGWLPGHGVTGRWSAVPAEDSLLLAASGGSFSQSSWGDVPVHLVTPQAGYGHAILAAGAIGAALFERQQSGHGQTVVCSGLHGCAAIRSGGAIRAATMQRMGAGRGSRGGSPNYRLYQCGDGQWLFLGTLTVRFFLRALEAMDLVDLLALEGVEGEIANLQRPPLSDEAIRQLDARFAERPREEWLSILQANGVPAGPVGDRGTWFEGEQIAANEMRVELSHPSLGAVVVPGISAKLAETPGRIGGLMTGVRLEDVGWQGPSPWAAGQARATHSGSGPLAGLRVLDLGAVIAGPFGPTVLANFGADVIKVEPPDGDSLRIAALGFAGWNRGKRGVVVDLKTGAGREVFEALVRTADVVVDNFRLGVTERLGIDHASLAAINPRIITVSVLGYGPTGPLASDPGFDPILQARSGLMAAQGGDDEPVFHTIPVNDEASGLMSAFATITALNVRERTGAGQHAWTSLANQSVVTQSGELTWYEGRPTAPLGGRDCAGESALHGLYECVDGWIAVVAADERRFERLAEALGRPEWCGRWPGASALGEPRDGPLAAEIAAAICGFTREAAAARLEECRVPAVIAIRTEESYDDPWLATNGFWEEYELPGHGAVLGVRGYAEFSRTPGGFVRAAPGLGEHTTEVLKDLEIAP